MQVPALNCRKEYKKGTSHDELVTGVLAEGHLPPIRTCVNAPVEAFIYCKNATGSASIQLPCFSFIDAFLRNTELSTFCYGNITQCSEVPTWQKPHCDPSFNVMSKDLAILSGSPTLLKAKYEKWGGLSKDLLSSHQSNLPSQRHTNITSLSTGLSAHEALHPWCQSIILRFKVDEQDKAQQHTLIFSAFRRSSTYGKRMRMSRRRDLSKQIHLKVFKSIYSLNGFSLFQAHNTCPSWRPLQFKKSLRSPNGGLQLR